MIAFYQQPTFQTIDAASGNNSSTSIKICELGEITEGVGRSLNQMKRSYDEMISTTCQETNALHQEIITGDDTSKHPHVHAIIDARCKCDVEAIDGKMEREEKLTKIYNVSIFSRPTSFTKKAVERVDSGKNILNRLVYVCRVFLRKYWIELKELAN